MTTNLREELRDLERRLATLEIEGRVKAPRGPRRIPRRFLAIAAVVLVSGVVVAAVSLTQLIPLVPVIGLTSQCGSGGPLTADNASVPVGDTGHILYSCGPGPAFHAIRGTDATPTFTLPAFYTGLFIVPFPSVDTLSCATISGNAQLTNNLGFIFQTASDWQYCAEYSNAGEGGLAGFTVTWTW